MKKAFLILLLVVAIISSIAAQEIKKVRKDSFEKKIFLARKFQVV
jgi:hypothetical protein